MAFKKRKEKKSKKKKGKKDEEWTHEGGVRVVDEHAQENGPKRRVRTQERDEQFRRSRMKQDERKRKMEFVEKMSKKVKFSDILNPEGAGSDDEEEAEDVEEEKPVHIPSTLHAADRLLQLVSKDMDEEVPKPRKAAAKVPEKATQPAIEPVEVEEEALELSFSRAVPVAVDDTDAPDGYDSDGSAAPDNTSASAVSTSSWFFDQTHDEQVEMVKSIESIPVLHGTMTSAVHPKAPTVPAISTLAAVPGLHKLWKHRPVALAPLSQSLLPKLLSYSDCYVDGRSASNDSALLETFLMHSIFHLVKSRAKVMKHNQRLKAKQQEQRLASAQTKGRETRQSKQAAPAVTTVSLQEDGAGMRDQGFTRPRLLILAPFRSSAKAIVQSLLSILGENTSVAGMDRLEQEYADPEPDSDDDAGLTEKQKQRKAEASNKQKPADWQAIFKGNVDDDFKLGVQVNPGHGKGQGDAKGCYVRLFSDFYISDIIIASPLGLKLIIDKSLEEEDGRDEIREGKEGGGKHKKSKGPCADFLSSIEQVIVHQADVLYMQNWEHVNYILSLTNKLPTEQHSETDYSRVRSYFLDKQGARHRQLMMSTYFNHPELLSFFRIYAQSLAGTVRTKRSWDGEDMLSQVAVPVKQVFQVLPAPASALAHYEDSKFNYFIDQVLSPMLRKKQKRTIIIAPSYFDYVRIRNYLIQQEASCAFVCEYSRESEISRGRAWFFHGVKDLMLYSGRMHFFRRFRMRGAKNAIFYSLPEYPHFYPEMVNMLSMNASSGGNEQEIMASSADDMMSCLVLSSKFEKLALERVIGQKRCDHMLSSNKSTFVFF